MRLPGLPGRNPNSKAIDAFIDDVRVYHSRNSGYYTWFDIKEMPHAEPVLKSGSEGAELIMELAERVAKKRSKGQAFEVTAEIIAIGQLVSELYQRQPRFTAAQIRRLAELHKSNSQFDWQFGTSRITSAILAKHRQEGLTEDVRAGLLLVAKILEKELAGPYSYTEERRKLRLIQDILAGRDPNAPTFHEPWQKPFERDGLTKVVEVASSARGHTPSSKWLKSANGALHEVEVTQVVDRFEESALAVSRMDRTVDAEQSDMLRGLCWMMGLTGHPRSAFLLGQMLLACGHKLSGFGARSQKGFSGCVDALARMGTTEALAELSKARAKIKTPSLAESLLKTLIKAAEKQGLPIAELEELVVPGFGLQLPGQRTVEMGELRAELRISGSTSAEVEWSRAGKPLKTKPAIPDQWKAEANELAKLKKEIESSLSAQKQRIESLYYIDRSWPHEIWRQRYVDHPLLANMSRRLIWSFETGGDEDLGMAPNGTVLGSDSKPLSGLGEGTTVRLWHPLDSNPATVEAWREFLFTNEIRQPFKQAHREVYVLTDAELRTETHSNRFAAHILRQHQMAALMRNRGWKYALMGGFDFHNTPTMPIPDSNLRVQFWVDVPPFVYEGDEHMTASGTAAYISTDQVCFVDPADTRVPLNQIPARIFSEAMRDVDLFVGVASVGNDPAWRDQGQRVGYGQYWQDVSFGLLSSTAETRKGVLERLLPKLNIASVSRIEGKFLVVKGKLRTYKIHLGSGNILMEPNDQYLCIVPTGVGKHDVFLPFEGDNTMAIILSKAFMLAKDTEIKDPTITRQIKG